MDDHLSEMMQEAIDALALAQAQFVSVHTRASLIGSLLHVGRPESDCHQGQE